MEHRVDRGLAVAVGPSHPTSFQLPRRQPVQAPIGSRIEAAMSRDALRRVAVVDDDPFMVKIMASLIRRVGAYSVQGFESAAIACDAVTAAGAGFDVVVLDLNMPGMDGIEFLHRLAQARCNSALILFSGEADELLRSTERLAIDQGLKVLGHVTKPPQLDVLEALLRGLDEEHIVASIADGHFGPAELLRAIADGEIVSLYKPVIDLRTGNIAVADTRLRWTHPRYGPLGPSAFMHVAHNAGMSVLLARESVAMALAAQQCWRELGCTLRVAIRVSGQALAEGDLADFVFDCASRHGAQPESVVLRLRTADVVSPAPPVAKTLARLRLHRFELALDDFGTGAMPLLQLADLGVAALRIAPKLIERARDGDAGLRALEVCADVAARLQARAVAGGVSSQADWERCRRAGLQFGDGPYISEPLAVHELCDRLSHGRASRCDVPSQTGRT